MTLAADITAEIAALFRRPAPPVEPARPDLARFRAEIVAEIQSAFLAALPATVAAEQAQAMANRYAERTAADLLGGRHDVTPLLSDPKRAGVWAPRIAATETRAAVLAARKAVRRLARKAARDGATTARHGQVRAFVALLLLLWGKLQDGSITERQYLTQVGQAYDTAIGEVPEAGRATLMRLRDLALERAGSVVEAIRAPDDDEDAPSEAQQANWANRAGGALWAGLLAAGAYRVHQDKQDTAEQARSEADAARARADQAAADGGTGQQAATDAAESAEAAASAAEERASTTVVTWILDEETGHPGDDDDATCDDCPDLDGQEWNIDAVPQWPGDGSTACGGACRCAVEWEGTDDTEDVKAAPAAVAVVTQPEAVAVSTVAVARCHVCGKRMGRLVNAGAWLWCARCREEREVKA